MGGTEARCKRVKVYLGKQAQPVGSVMANAKLLVPLESRIDKLSCGKNYDGVLK